MFFSVVEACVWQSLFFSLWNGVPYLSCAVDEFFMCAK